MIHIFHDWSKWSTVETRNYLWADNPKFIDFVKYIQQRTCNTCGKSEVREVAQI